MKVAVECISPLLQKSLELFLEKYLSSSKQSDIIVKDRECFDDEKCFYIANSANADLIKPFSKSQLILKLEKRYKQLYLKEKEEENLSPVFNNTAPLGFDILEKRIEMLTQEYQSNILRAVKTFYEK